MVSDESSSKQSSREEASSSECTVFYEEEVDYNLDLFQSIELGKLDRFLICYEHCKEKKVRHPEYNFSPIHWACMTGSLEILHSLTEKFTPDDINENDNLQKFTPLHLAAIKGHDLCLEALIYRDCTMNLLDHCGRTALHLAAAHNASHCIEILLKNGADIDCTDNNLWTPVLHAAYHGRVGCLETLVREGGKTNVTDKDGNTPAHLAAMEGHLEALKFVLFNGEREMNEVFDSLNDYGQTPLLIAAQYYKDPIINYLNDLTNHTLLHETKMDINFPAHVAAFRGDMDALERLVTNGVVNINQRDCNGYALIHKAALKGNIKLIEWLEEQGAYLDICTKDGENIIDIGLRRGHHHLVEYLENRRKQNDESEEELMVVCSADGISSVKLLGKQLTSAQTKAKEKLRSLEKELEIAKMNLKQLKVPEFSHVDAKRNHELLKKIDELNVMLELEREKREELEMKVKNQKQKVLSLQIKLKDAITENEEILNRKSIAYLPGPVIDPPKVGLKDLKSSEGGILVRRTNSF